MKVLISYAFCTKGGVETALYNRLKELDRNQLKADLHFFRDYGGVPLFEDYSGEIIIQPNAESLQKIIEEKNYDAVISIDTVEILRILQKMDYKGKIGLEVHTTYEQNLKYLEDKIIDIVDFVIVPSQYQKNLVQNRIAHKKIHVLGNAVSDCITYHKDSVVKSGKRVVLWVGRIDQHKNWRLFLKIASELHKRDGNYVFWIVGGLKSESLEINEFEKMIYQYGLECVVRWIPQAPYDRISEIYSCAANSGGCYISTSINESFGMTIIEAMACRCPVIVNQVGALPELVEHGRGLCLEEMETSEQIEKIQAFLSEAQHTAMVEKAQEYVRNHFSSMNIGRDFQKIIEREINGEEYKSSIGIFGSCVSRDIFEWDGHDRFHIAWYFARSSVVSAVSEPLGYIGTINLPSEFQKKMVMSDLNKSYWQTMRKDIPEYILIDFIDERYEIARAGKSYFTLSDEFNASDCLIEYTKVERKEGGDGYYIEETPVLIYLKEFVKRIKEIFPERRVILHKAKMIDYYKSAQGEIKKFSKDYCKYNKKINDMLSFMYAYVEKEMENCVVLECEEEYYADERHKWGLMPMHYEEKYYKEIYYKLCNVIEQK